MSKSVIKIAIIEPVGGHGGMDYYDFGLCGGLTFAGVNVVLHTCEETRFPEDAAFEVRHTFRGIYGKDAVWRRGLRYVCGTFVSLLSAVREGRRIVHFHFFHVGSLQMMQVLLARIFMRKIVITTHDVESFVEGLESPILNRLAYRMAHRVIAHNQVSKKELIERIGLTSKGINVIPHGNYLHAIQPLPSQEKSRRKLGIPEHAKVLLFFGQIKDVKGLDLLIKAMPAVLKQHPGALILIAGRPWKSDFSAYEKGMEDLGIREHCITHIRYIHNEDVPFYYGASDIVVLPYRHIYQSGVLLMTMSYGIPVIASDLPGMKEIITNEENGFLFPSENYASLAELVSRLLKNPGLAWDVGRNGKKYVSLHHDWDLIGKKTADYYNEVMETGCA